VGFLPDNYEEPWTLASSVTREGIGLHTGESSLVKLSPNNQPGFFLSWIGDDTPPIQLDISHARNSELCTTLDFGSRSLGTVEHLFAALSGCGLSHVKIEVSNEEIPLLDGSSLGWVEAINEAGIVKASGARPNSPELLKPLIINRGNSVICATPSEKFSLICIIDFPYKAIGSQIFKCELNPYKFVEEIASARTFGFKDQINILKDSGLIKGGSLNNALVCDGDYWINPPLRFKDEPVRHKMLDLIGDLALVGFPKAQVLVYRGSHGLHMDFAKALQNNLFKSELH